MSYHRATLGATPRVNTLLPRDRAFETDMLDAGGHEPATQSSFSFEQDTFVFVQSLPAKASEEEEAATIAACIAMAVAPAVQGAEEVR